MLNALKILPLFLAGHAWGQNVPPEWPFSQELTAPQPGLTQVELSPEVLARGKEDLSDLRLLDRDGREVPFFINRPVIQASKEASLRSLQMRMEPQKTVIEGEIPPEFAADGINAVYLVSPSDDFLKPISLAVSRDRRHWKGIFDSRPIFKQPGRPLSTTLQFEPLNASYLRITLDDSRTPPIRVQDLRLWARPKALPNLKSVPLEWPPSVANGGKTELNLSLPAPNLTLDSIRIDAQDGVFAREVAAFAKVFSDGDFHDELMGTGYIYRVSKGPQGAEELSLNLRRRIPGRALILRINDGDSPALSIKGVSAAVIPSFLMFDAPALGTYKLIFGNILAAPRRYDVAALGERLLQTRFNGASVGPVSQNPSFRAPEVLPEVPSVGSPLDTSTWRYRRKVLLTDAGLQRIELDPEILAHDGNRLADLRLTRDGKQIPYVLDQTGVTRELGLDVKESPQEKSKSRWVVELPQKGIPLSSVRFSVSEPLFSRSVALYQEAADDRGDTVRQDLGVGNWARTGQNGNQEFEIPLFKNPLRSDRLILEIENGDNPPLHIARARGFYQAPRLYFKATPGADIFLHYGQDQAGRPQYDIDIISREIMSVVPAEARLAPEEALHAANWWEAPVPSGRAKYFFWSILAAVAVGLILIIRKLLPEEPASF